MKLDYDFINWGPFVMKTKLPEDIINTLLLKAKSELKDFNRSLAGHLNKQFEYDSETQSWFFDRFLLYLQLYRDGHCKFHGLEKLNVEYTPHSLWVNFMEPGDFNPPHIHTGDLSFVIFLDVPDELKKEQKEFKGTWAPPGSLIFNFTQNARPMWATTERYFRPETGDLIIFPTLLTHSVCPFKSKVQRISVSGNLEVTNRNSLPDDYF